MTTHSNSAARILDAALTLFSQKGYGATSTREICELAGITKPTLYYFYKSKEGVYRALIAEADKEFSRILQLGLDSGGTLRDRYKIVAEQFFHGVIRQERLAHFMFSITWAPNAPLTPEVHKLYDSGMKLMADAAREAARAGEIKDGNADVRTLVLMGGLMEALSDFLFMGHPKLTRKLAHEIVDTVFDGWMPQHAKVQK